MLWASCKDYAVALQMRVLSECTASGVVFDLGEFSFPGKPYALLVWVEYLIKTCQNSQHMKRIIWWLPEICPVFQTLAKVLQNKSVAILLVYTQCPAVNFDLQSIVMRRNVRPHSHVHHTPHHWIPLCFEMLLCLSNKLNYFIGFECFGLLYNIIF